MSPPVKNVLKFLVLLYLCASAVCNPKTEVNETKDEDETGLSAAETTRVETVHLHKQEIQPRSKGYTYDQHGNGYLEQDPAYGKDGSDESAYEFGKRVVKTQYKSNPGGDSYHQPQQVIQPEYIDSHEQYGHHPITSHSYSSKDPTGGKDGSYEQHDAYGPTDYKDSSGYAKDASNGADKSSVQQYSHVAIPKPSQYTSDESEYSSGQSSYGSDESKSHEEANGHEADSYYPGGVHEYSYSPKKISQSKIYSTGSERYSTDDQVSHFPVFPKESGYISNVQDDEQSSYQPESHKEYTQQKEGRYIPSTSSKSAKDISLHQKGTSDGASKMSVYIKQLGHSKLGDKFGLKNGERHGYLLLPIVPGKDGDKIKIDSGSYGGNGYKHGQEDHATAYVSKPSGGKSSYTSYFKTGSSAYGGDSKLDHQEGKDYSSTALKTAGGQAYETGRAINGYPTRVDNSKGTPYEGKQQVYITQESDAYPEKGSHGYGDGHKSVISSGDYAGGGRILSDSVKYVSAQEYQPHQQSYRSHEPSSYAIVSHPEYTQEKVASYQPVETVYHNFESQKSQKKGSAYEGQTGKSSSYGQEARELILPQGVHYISRDKEFERGYNVQPYGSAAIQKQVEQKSKEYQPLQYGAFVPMPNPYSSYGGHRNQKSLTHAQGRSPSYGKGQAAPHGYESTKTIHLHKKPKSIALILQRQQHQQGYQGQGESYGPSPFPSGSARYSKSLSSAYGGDTGFRPIIGKQGTSLYHQASVRSPFVIAKNSHRFR